jgi:hypothetical protein
MDKNNIKALLNHTFVNEEKVPGLDVTNKVKADNGKINKKAIKDVGTELSSYDKESKKATKDAIKPVKFNYTDDSEEEYHQEMEIMNGQEMIQYDRTPSEEYKKRAEEAIEGSTRMGNNPEWANVVAAGQGGDPEFGKKLVKAIKASAKRRSDDTPTTKMFGDDWEVTKDHSHKAYAMESEKNNKETIKESEKMKRLKFKKPFNGVNNALNLIPENYKVDNKVFEMSDGNESYKVRWEGSLNEGKGVVLIASDATLVNEDVQKMKHLMGYNSKETFGNLKGAERLAEDKNFSKIWDKTKTLLSEGMGDWSPKQLGAFDKGDHDGTPFEPEDMDALRKDEAMYEMDATGTMDAAAPVNQAKIKGDMMSILKQDVSKMGTGEKMVFDSLITKISDFLAQAGNQSAGQFKTLMDRMVALVDKELQDNQAAAPMAEMGETPQMDRFDEVFSDLADDETMEEGKVGDFFRKVGSSIGGFDRAIEKVLQTPEGQEFEKSFMESENENDWFAKYSRALARATAQGGSFDTAGGASIQTKDVVEYLRKKKSDSKVAE